MHNTEELLPRAESHNEDANTQTVSPECAWQSGNWFPAQNLWRFLEIAVAFRCPVSLVYAGLKATDTHSERVKRAAFPWQQWLGERASVLRLYGHCPSC